MLTTLVSSLHRSDVNNNVVTPQSVALQLIQQKRPGLKQNTLLIEDIIKYGHSPSLYPRKNILIKSGKLWD